MDEYAQSMQIHQIYLTMCELIFQSFVCVNTSFPSSKLFVAMYTKYLFWALFIFPATMRPFLEVK